MCVKGVSERRLVRLLLLWVLCGVMVPRCAGSAVLKEAGGIGPTEMKFDLPVMATAFVQTGNELHYFSDVEYHENLIGGAPVKSSIESEPMLNNQLQFSPKEISFGEQSIGVPHQQKVRIHNPTASTVRFDAISGSTVHFHCSFPEHKTVNPGESTSFDVVFLPRQEGPIDNVLFVHSSLGTFTYTVRGNGASNPYRIRPFVGAKVPLNGTFISAVQLHNPHPNTLRITEMYTSGADLHLELPLLSSDNVDNAAIKSNLWEIAPYQTKTVMNAKMLAAKERNANAFIKIKTDLKRKRNRIGITDGENDADEEQERSEETLIVPLEVEVTKKRGIFATVDLLDFGLIKWGEKSPQLTLEIISTLEKGIDIESLYVERNDQPNGIYMEFASKPPISIKCGARQQPGAPKAIAKITFDSKLLKPPTHQGAKLLRYKGRIIADSRGGNYNVSVPYVAAVYRGSLDQSADETAFHSQLEPPVSHGVSLTNNLPFGIAIWNISLGKNAQKSFVVKLLSRVVTLEAGESRPVFWLKYAKKERDDFTSHCTLHTNVTTFSIPIVIFNGKLRVYLYSIDQSQFDFGLMDAGDTRSIQFAITNENPVAVQVKQLRNALPTMTSLRLLGIEAGNQTVLSNTNERDLSHIWQEGMDFTLPGHSFAVFKYTLTAPSDRTVLRDVFVIETDFERMTYPVKYSLDEGAVVSVPEKLTFRRSFPGKMSSQVLQMYSTFKKDMQVLRMSSLSHDPRIFFESFPANNPPVLKSSQLSNLGRVLFMPGATCTDDCYVGMPLHTADGQWFTYGMKLPQNLAEIDSYLYKRLRRKWLALKANGKHLVNATVVIDTDDVKHLSVPVQGELVWPRLLTRSVVHFPLTAVGNFTIVNLTLTNPSSLPVVVQLLPLVIYPDAETLVELFKDELEEPLTDPIEMNETLMFSLRDTELFTLKRDSPVPKLREQLERVLGIQIPKFTLSMMLQPSMKVRIRVGFLPSDYTLRSSLLLIRNNLTVMEPVILYGRGAHMDMQVEGRAARTRDPLMFEIQPHHLSDCHNPKRLTHKLFTTLTVKRSFTVVNTGEVAFTIVNMSLNNIACENRGFKILNCHPFTLAPNQSHIVDIAYTPDFLMSWNEAALQFYMHMNGTSWLFPLGASVPRHLLSKCHSALPRPPFESLMYYSCVSALVFCLVCVVACAYLEGDRTVTCAIRQQYSQQRRVFDLNAIDASGINKQTASSNAATAATKQHASPRRHVLHYAPDANILVRSFWQTANAVLWLFSFVWQFRGDEPSPSSKNERNRVTKAKAPVVKSIHVQTNNNFYTKRGSTKTSTADTTTSTDGNIMSYYKTISGRLIVSFDRDTRRNVNKGNAAKSNEANGRNPSKNSPKINGEIRSTKKKGRNSSRTSSSSQSQRTKSTDPSPSSARREPAISKSDNTNQTALINSNVQNWIENVDYGIVTKQQQQPPKVSAAQRTDGGRKRSESVSDAQLISSKQRSLTNDHSQAPTARTEAIIDGDISREFHQNQLKQHKEGLSRSGDELTTKRSKATKASNEPMKLGSNLFTRTTVRKSNSLEPSAAFESAGDMEERGTASSISSGDVDSDILSSGGGYVCDISDKMVSDQHSHARLNSGAECDARNWTHSRQSLDERSEAGLSDASAAPEWADSNLANSLEGNVDEDFSALAMAAACLFDANDKNGDTNKEYDYSVANQQQSQHKTTKQSSRRNAKKKYNAHTNANNLYSVKANKQSAASSRSASCSSMDATNSASRNKDLPTQSPNTNKNDAVYHANQSHPYQPIPNQQQPQQQPYSKQRRRSSQQQKSSQQLNIPPFNRSAEKPGGALKPSAFIQQLQMERKTAEEKYLKKKKKNKSNAAAAAAVEDASREVWPGFNLKLPALAENLWDMEYEMSGEVVGCGDVNATRSQQRSSMSRWNQQHQQQNIGDSDGTTSSQSSVWPLRPPPTNRAASGSKSSSTDAVAQSVRAFRLNPQAQPFFIDATAPCAVVAAAGTNNTPVQPPLGVAAATTTATDTTAADSSSVIMKLLTDPNISMNNTSTATVQNQGATSRLGAGSVPSTSGLFDGLMDDPLGLSGSLFGRGATNIWASGLSSSATTTTNPLNDLSANTPSEGSNADTNCAAIFWAEQFLADQENDNK